MMILWQSSPVWATFGQFRPPPGVLEPKPVRSEKNVSQPRRGRNRLLHHHHLLFFFYPGVSCAVGCWPTARAPPGKSISPFFCSPAPGGGGAIIPPQSPIPPGLQGPPARLPMHPRGTQPSLKRSLGWTAYRKVWTAQACA